MSKESGKVKFKSDIKFVDIDSIKPNDYNPNYQPQETYDGLVDGIKRYGFYGAIEINKDNIIINGEHRWRALKSLGEKKVPVILEEDAKKGDNLSRILTLRLNRDRGYLVPVETAQNLQVLAKDIPIDILAEATHIPQDEINLLTQTKFDPELQNKTKTDERVQWGNVEQMVSNLADMIRENEDGKFMHIYTISKGGLVPARLLADRLHIDSIHVLHDGEDPPTGLVVDDIYDTGKTYRKWGKHAKIYATLHLRNGKEPPKNVIFATKTEGAEYIVYPWDKLEFKRKNSTSKRKT